MTNTIILENKISTVKKYLKILDEFKNVTVDDLEKDIKTKGAVERYLYLMC